MTPEWTRSALLGVTGRTFLLPAPAEPFEGPGAILEALRGAVARAGARAAVGLSGGLDSAAVLALAGPSRRAWSLTDGEADPELDRARAHAERCGATHTVVVVPEATLPDGFEAAVRAAGVPLVNGLAVAKHRFFAAVAAAGESSILSGVGADEVFYGQPSSDGLESAAAALAASLLAPEWRLDPPLSRDPDPRRHALQRTLPELTLVAERDMARSHGVDVHLPFLDPAVVAPALAMPLAAQLHGPLGKWSLREALRGVVSEALRLAPKTPHLRQTGGARWASLLGDLLTEERVRDLVVLDPRAVRRLLGAHAAQPDAARDRVLMRVASLVVVAGMR